MSDPSFQRYLSQVASRLRHDLKGGLITLKMGLESLGDGEDLKPLLLEKTDELVELSDKLVLLLRMGELAKVKTNPQSLFRHAASRAEELFPPLKVEVIPSDGESDRWEVDPDAVTYAVLELAQNASLARAQKLTIRMDSNQKGRVSVTDDGTGLSDGSPEAVQGLLELGRSGWNRSGLGLSIVEGCMRGHGGSFRLDAGENGEVDAALEFELEGSR
jgi:signal transduction histidine kinase